MERSDCSNTSGLNSLDSVLDFGSDPADSLKLDRLLVHFPPNLGLGLISSSSSAASRQVPGDATEDDEGKEELISLADVAERSTPGFRSSGSGEVRGGLEGREGEVIICRIGLASDMMMLDAGNGSFDV
jgi:hypothetical protein